jgi:hypothetical protein
MRSLPCPPFSMWPMCKQKRQTPSDPVLRELNSKAGRSAHGAKEQDLEVRCWGLYCTPELERAWRGERRGG